MQSVARMTGGKYRFITHSGIVELATGAGSPAVMPASLNPTSLQGVMLEHGLKAEQAGKATDALKSYQQVILLFPDSAAAVKADEGQRRVLKMIKDGEIE